MLDSVPAESSARRNEELLQFEIGQVFSYLMFVFAQISTSSTLNQIAPNDKHTNSRWRIIRPLRSLRGNLVRNIFEIFLGSIFLDILPPF